jgi:SAM-dependent methyltransferase
MLDPMTSSRDELDRIQRLRELFLDDGRTSALADYWRSEADLQAYDDVLGARIGWKWDAALPECVARGWPRADGATVLDFGCGTGIAGRRFAAHCGAGEVLCHDRSGAAMEFAARRIRETAPGTAARALRDVADASPDVLLVSHVLGELDERGLHALQQLVARSQSVLVVEPGSRAIARRLSALRDALRPQFRILAPCTHAADCPALATADDWCHFFAPPPPEVFTDGGWARTARALGIDLRALPYAFVAAVRGPQAPAAAGFDRLLGRPHLSKHSATVSVCSADGIRNVVVDKRRQPVLWRTLKKQPEQVTVLPQEPPPAST